MERLASAFGIVVLLGLGYAMSNARKRISWRIVWVGILLQAYLALFIVRSEWVPWILSIAVAACVVAILAGRALGVPRALIGLAKGLGLLGFATTLGHQALQLGGWWLLLFLPAVIVFFVRGPMRPILAIAGSVTVSLSVWAWGLPQDFVFRAIEGIGKGVTWVIGFAALGSKWIFGGIERGPFVFAIDVGSIIILFGGLMSLLYYLGVIPWIVGLLARILHRALGVSGAESLAAASNVFVGQTEAPLIVRPYLKGMTKSEIMSLMTGGFATIAGSVLGAYVLMFNRAGIARGAADLIAASVMSAPAAFVFAKLIVPETEESETSGGAALPRDAVGSNALDALTGGVTAGLKLAVNVLAMLLVFYALIAMLDASVGWVCGFFGRPDINFSLIYSALFAPFAFLMGVPWHDCVAVGQFLGTKTIFNEFIAYEQLTKAMEVQRISLRAGILSTYALCGFANFMSIGIQIGGLSQLAPALRSTYSKLALRAMIAGALACQLTACIVGILGEF